MIHMVPSHSLTLNCSRLSLRAYIFMSHGQEESVEQCVEYGPARNGELVTKRSLRFALSS